MAVRFLSDVASIPRTASPTSSRSRITTDAVGLDSPAIVGSLGDQERRHIPAVSSPSPPSGAAFNQLDMPSPTIDFCLRLSAERIMLYGTYFQLHPGTIDTGLSYLLQQGSRSPAMVSALDAAALLYMGSTHKIPSYMHHAQRRYTHALGQLRRELIVGETPPETIFSIIHTMETCELFRITSDTNLAGWQHHALGNVSLMKKVFESSVEVEIWQALAPTLLSDARVPFSLWLGLARRERLNAHELFWTKCENHSHILRTAMTVPGVLENADKALETAARGFSKSRLTKSLATLVRAQQRLHLALEDWCLQNSQQPYTLSSDIDFSDSLSRRNDIDGLMGPSLTFSSLSAATTHLTYWLCLLILQAARIDTTKALNNGDHPEISKLLEDANGYAASICKTMAYCTLPRHGFAGRMNIVGPLALVSGWYRRESDMLRLKWCEDVAARLEDAGLASPVAATMCSC